MPSIPDKLKIYIGHDIAPNITLETIKNESENNLFNLIKHKNHHDQSIFSVDKNEIDLSSIFKSSKEKIKVRVLLPQKFKKDNFNAYEEKMESLIIHIHGGGFIGMSSMSHQSYTRK